MTTPATSVTINGVTFETSYTDNNSFAQLIIDSYNAGIPIRSPGREFILENSTSSTYVMSGFANSEIIPDDIMGTSAYLDSVIDQVGYLPAGYVVTFIIESTNVGGEIVSNLTYQQVTEGIWDVIDSFEFNTIKKIASYNEYDNGVIPNAPSVIAEAVFGSGMVSSPSYSESSITSVYTYSNNTVKTGTDLTYTTYGLAAAGNSTIGVFGGGSTGSILSTTSIYTYSSNTTAVGADLTYASEGMAAAGNSTLGVFGGGGSPAVSTTSIYTYSSNMTTAGTDLTYASAGITAVGNSTLGVFGGGYDSGFLSTTSIYTYSSNATVVGTDLTYASAGMAAAGNSTLGVFGGGKSVNGYLLSTTSIYTYSGNTTAAGTDLTYNSVFLAAVSSNNVGVIQ